MTSTEPPFFKFFKIIQSLDLKNNSKEKLDQFYIDEKEEIAQISRQPLFNCLFVSGLAISAILALLPPLFRGFDGNGFWILINLIIHCTVICGLLFNHETKPLAENAEKEREIIDISLSEEKKKKKQVLDKKFEAYVQKVNPILSSELNQTILMDAFLKYFHLGTAESQDETSWFKCLQSCFENKNYDKAPYYIRKLYNRIDGSIMARKLGFNHETPEGNITSKPNTPQLLETQSVITPDVFAQAKESVSRLTLETKEILKLANFDQDTGFKLKNILEQKLPETLRAFCAIRPECLHDKDFNNKSPTDIFNASLNLIENYLTETKKNQNVQQVKVMEINRRHIEKSVA